MSGTLYIDFDGTLHNTGRIYEEALTNVVLEMEKRGWIKDVNIKEKKVQKYLGWKREEMWDDFLEELSREQKVQGSQWLGEKMMEEYDRSPNCLYPNVPEVLKECKKKGYTLVFLSNCSRHYRDKVREKYHLEEYFDEFLCAEDFPGKTKGEIIEETKENFPPGVAVIGDRHHDMEGAKEHGLLPIFCTYGFGEKEEGEGCIAISSFKEVLDHV